MASSRDNCQLPRRCVCVCVCACGELRNVFPICFDLSWLGSAVFQHTRRVQKKDRTFAIKTLFYNILSTAPFKLAPCTGDTPSPTFLPLLERFLKRTFCGGAPFSYRIFQNLRVFKKRQNFLNSAPTITEGALRLLSAPSGRFWQKLPFASFCYEH
jgi:hypothetical protein